MKVSERWNHWFIRNEVTIHSILPSELILKMHNGTTCQHKIFRKLGKNATVTFKTIQAVYESGAMIRKNRF